MGFYLKGLLFFFCFSFQFLRADQNPQVGKILYLLQQGVISDGISAYLRYAEEMGKDDCELLQQIGLALLHHGSHSSEPEVQLLTLYGAGIAAHESVLPILERGLQSPNPILQLVSLNFLSQYQNDSADIMLNTAFHSQNLLIRLQAAYRLAQKKSPKAISQIDSLMNKVNPVLLPIFPQFYAVLGTTQATHALRRLLSHKDEKVRVAALNAIIKTERDDLLPAIHTLSMQHNALHQEGCAAAFGVFKDESSIPKLKKLAQSSVSFVKIAALYSLHQLECHDAKISLESLANQGNIFAISVLANVSDSKDCLYSLTKHPDLQIKANAAIALLQHKDPRCLKTLAEILIKDSRDLAITSVPSPGMALEAFKIIPNTKENSEKMASLLEESLEIKEEIINDARNLLSEEQFLSLARAMFELQQNDLIPQFISCIESMSSQNAIEFFKKFQQKPGAPLIRNYCNLALYRLKEEGPYGQNLQNWIQQQKSSELIRFRPVIEKEAWHPKTYQLTPQEISRLLVESIEALISQQDEQATAILLDAIQSGNKQNKYALAGLLIRSAL